MRKKILIFFTLSLFFLVLLSSIYLILRLKKSSQEQISTPQPSEKSYLVTQRAGDPLRKSISIDKIVTYTLEGFFDGEFEQKDPYYINYFVLKDDVLKRRIKVFVGSGNEKIYLGKYQGDFNSNSTWQSYPLADLLKYVKKSQPVILTTYLGPVSDLEKLEGSQDKQSVLDKIIEEYHSNEFKISIPPDFILYVYKIGTIE